jgi:D-glycero-D-manno-heptose 1,7-bisphosphate phosphatase
MGIGGWMSKCAIFLDRDGVINKSIVREGKLYPPENLSQMKLLSGVKEALTLFKQAGFLIIVVTNQPDVARGTVEKNEVDAIHRALLECLPLDEIMVCFHDNKDKCSCRKPKPGFLFAAAEKWDIRLSESYMIGDRWSDMAAGVSAGCKTVFIDYDYDEKRPESYDFQVKTLFEAAFLLTKDIGRRKHETD